MIKILSSGVVCSKKNPKSKEFRYFAEKTRTTIKKMKLNQGNIFLLKNKNGEASQNQTKSREYLYCGEILN